MLAGVLFCAVLSGPASDIDVKVAVAMQSNLVAFEKPKAQKPCDDKCPCKCTDKANCKCKTCKTCSDKCVCGCKKTGVCKCKVTVFPAPAVVNVPQVVIPGQAQPVYQSPTFFYMQQQPVYRPAPRMFFRGCSGGG